MLRIVAWMALGVGALAGLPAVAGQQAGTDPAAYVMLKEAHDKREVFPAGFMGVSADLTVNDNGKEAKGSFTYPSSGEMKVTLEGASKETEQWAQEQLGSAFSHRRGDDFAKGDGMHTLTFAPDDHSPIGRLVQLNDRFKSADRVKDGRITEVNRTMGPMRFTITMMQFRNTGGGKNLPSQFMVTYFDTASGAIKKVDAYSDGFKQVGDAWIPSSRRVVTAENGVFTARSFTLSNIKPLGAASAKQ